MSEYPPLDIKDVLVEGLQRWQCGRILDTLPEGNQEVLWPRAARAIAAARGAADERGALQSVWAGGRFTAEWRCSKGCQDSPECDARGAERGALRHRWCG